MKLRSGLLAGIIFVLPLSQAATLVEIKDTEGMTRIFRDGSKSRLEMPGEDGYMVIDNGGRIVSEVVRIDTDAELPANAFSIPAGYKVQNTDQMMRDTMQQLQQMPDMQEMMKQMQQMQQQ